VKLITSMKKIVPIWVRIMRIQRDIPNPIIEAGVDKSNLRQLVHENMRQHSVKCRCIRCREVGHKIGEELGSEDLEIFHTEYGASDGIENFITVENSETDSLVGFLRLRMPSEIAIRPEVLSSSAFVRELHVYGRMVPVGSRMLDGWQHRGWGEELMKEAERIALEKYDVEKLLVMSALGTKVYYERLGYRRDGVYMSKTL
jgi:elongator complex protein 3